MLLGAFVKLSNKLGKREVQYGISLGVHMHLLKSVPHESTPLAMKPESKASKKQGEQKEGNGPQLNDDESKIPTCWQRRSFPIAFQRGTPGGCTPDVGPCRTPEAKLGQGQC